VNDCDSVTCVLAETLAKVTVAQQRSGSLQ